MKYLLIILFVGLLHPSYAQIICDSVKEVKDKSSKEVRWETNPQVMGDFEKKIEYMLRANKDKGIGGTKISRTMILVAEGTSLVSHNIVKYDKVRPSITFKLGIATIFATRS